MYRNRRIEIGKENYQYGENEVIPKSGIAHKRLHETAIGVIGRESDQCNRDKHDSLCKNDRHNPCCIDFQRDILASASVLFITYHTFGVLHGYFAGSLHQKYRRCNHEKQEYDFGEEHDKTTRSGSCTHNELLHERLRQTGDNTDQNDKRYTVSDASVGDTLTQPHDKHTTCGKNYRRRNRKQNIGRECASHLNTEVDQISRSLNKENENRQVTGILIEFASSAFTFTLQFLEIRQSHTEQLDYDRSRNIRHYTQRKNRGIGEGTSREHIEQLHQTATCLGAQLGKELRIDTG